MSKKDFPSLSQDERIELAQLIINLLISWRVSESSQVVLLSLPESTRPRTMRKYLKDTPLPDDPQVLERAEHFLGIADALRTSYPRNAEMGGIWLNTTNRRFNQRTPLRSMLEDGIQGIVAVRAHLDCAWSWRQDGSENSE